MRIRKTCAILATVGSLCMPACAPLQVKPMVGDMSPGETLHLKVANVTIKNHASEETFVSGLSSEPQPIQRGVQGQFHALLLKELAQLLQPEGGYADSKLKATALLNKASVKMTNQFIKFVPFAGFLFLGLDEQFIATAEGAVEIEDGDGRVLRTAAFKVEAKEIGKNALEEQLLENVNKVIGKALLELRTQISSVGRRYLYEYVDQRTQHMKK